MTDSDLLSVTLIIIIIIIIICTWYTCNCFSFFIE